MLTGKQNDIIVGIDPASKESLGAMCIMNRKTGEATIHTLKSEYLTIGEAINWMLESEDNVIEYDFGEVIKFKECIRGKEFFCSEKGGEWQVDEDSMSTILDWKNIRKHIEPKKTLKEKLENKETFEYKSNWYRFNKDGAIIDSKGSAVSIELIKELLPNNKG